MQRLFRDSLDGLLRASPPPPRATAGAGPRPTYLGGTASHVFVVLGAPIPRTSKYFTYLFNYLFSLLFICHSFFYLFIYAANSGIV